MKLLNVLLTIGAVAPFAVAQANKDTSTIAALHTPDDTSGTLIADTRAADDQYGGECYMRVIWHQVCYRGNDDARTPETYVSIDKIVDGKCNSDGSGCTLLSDKLYQQWINHNGVGDFPAGVWTLNGGAVKGGNSGLTDNLAISMYDDKLRLGFEYQGCYWTTLDVKTPTNNP